MSSAKGQAPKQPAKEQAPAKPKEQQKAAPAAASKPKDQKVAAPAAAAAAPAKVNGKEKVAAPAKESSPQPAAKEAAKPAAKVAKPAAKPAKETTPEPEQNPDAKLGPFAEVIAKRLRALKKRLAKIEKNEELQAQGHKLDQDQLKSVAQKVEVLHLITELEDISKIFVEVQFEEDKLEKAEKKRLALEEQKKIVALKEEQQQEFKKLIEPLFVLNVLGEEEFRTLLTTQGIEGFLLSQEELQSLDSLATSLYGKYQPSVGLAAGSTKFFNRLRKLSTKNTDNIVSGLSYTNAQNLLNKLSTSPFFDPELAAKLAKERADREAAEEAARREQEEMQNSYEIIAPEEIPPFAPMSPEQMNGLPGGAPLAFIGASEVLGVQPVLTFDGSPSVVVPIPQTLFYAQIATPLYSSFRPTFQQQQQPIQPSIPQQQPAAQPEPAAASQEPAPSQSSSSSQPAAQDASIASTQPTQPPQQRYNNNQNGRGRGGFRNFPPQERNFQDQKFPDQRRFNSAPHDRSYQGYQERGNQDRPQQPRAERGGAAGGHRGGRGGFRGAKAPQSA